MIEVSEDDIQWVQQQMNVVFNKEAREVLRCLESVDIQACPGAGKTTLLVAKLLILERKLPDIDGGICIITHTNVGIDEIRKKAGASSKLFKDPCFCGTIQSFVDRFLAIPYYSQTFQRRPAYIDTDIYESRMTREYWERRKNGLSVLPDPEQGKNRWLRLRPKRQSDRSIVLIDKATGKVTYKTPTAKIYKQFNEARRKLYGEGILSFDDTYYIAKNYIENYPQLLQAFRKRFRYVFIDEMQDTSNEQSAIIDMLFGKGVVLQRFGDCNQAIFEGESRGDWKPNDSHLSLSTTQRMSTSICNVIFHICHKPHESLVGHDRTTFPPTLLLFDDSQVASVLPAFTHLIAERQLSSIAHPFKAIGRVAAPNTVTSRHTLSSYFPAFVRPRTPTNSYHQTLRAYIDLPIDQDVNKYRLAIIEGIRQALYLQGIKSSNGKPYTNHYLLKDLSNADQITFKNLQSRLVEWCRNLRKGIDCTAEISEMIRTSILPALGTSTLKDTVEQFLTGSEPTPASQSPHRETNTTFRYQPDPNGEEIAIDVATIHSVKGETHTATLYLETYFKGYDLNYIRERLKRPTEYLPNSMPHKVLPLAYVAMTRATDFLCVAMHKDGDAVTKPITSDDIIEFQSAGWLVLSVDDIINTMYVAIDQMPIETTAQET